jgi:virulence-associated protein VapD
MKTRIFILFLFSSNLCFAGVGENICSQLYPEDGIDSLNNKDYSRPGTLDLMLFAGKLLFKPSSLVDIHKIENNLQTNIKSDGVKLAIITTETTHLSKDENEKLDQYREKLSEIRRELKRHGFQKKIRSINSKESCITYISSDLQLESKLQELQDLVESNFSLITKFEEEKTTIEIEAKEKFLSRKNWVIIKEKNVNEIHHLIKKTNPSAVLLLSHSSADGKLFDHKLNPFPSGYFQSLKGNIDNLIIYSCYTDEVIKKYKLDEIARNMNIFYPKAKKKMSQFIGKKTPVIALKSIKNLKFYSTKENKTKEECMINFKRKLPVEFGVFLNGVYLSSGSDEVSFDCSLLKDSNQIEIYSTIETEFEGKLEIKEALLNSYQEIPLEEFNTSSTNRHIETKGSFNK